MRNYVYFHYYFINPFDIRVYLHKSVHSETKRLVPYYYISPFTSSTRLLPSLLVREFKINCKSNRSQLSNSPDIPYQIYGIVYLVNLRFTDRYYYRGCSISFHVSNALCVRTSLETIVRDIHFRVYYAKQCII